MSAETKQSYTIRFRNLVRELSKLHTEPIIDNTNAKKRTYENSFGSRDYEIERYGQEIDANYFDSNCGHAVIG